MIDKFRESSTFKIVLILLLAEIIAFIYSYSTASPISIVDFAQATGITVALWLGREWRAAAYTDG